MKNVMNFYLFNNKLKKILRRGWLEVSIKADRIESVAEHIHGCLILALSINEEFKLGLNMEKILKMLTLHETEEIIMDDLSYRSNISKEEKSIIGKKAVKKIIKGLINENEINVLINEFNAKTTKEAKFAYHIDKLECDFQAKVYDLEGNFDIEKEKEDCLAWYGEKAIDIISKASCASDIWLDCDKHLYDDDELFKEILNSIKNITQDEYDEVINTETE